MKLFIITLLSILTFGNVEETPLILKLTNVQNASGTIRIGIYTPKNKFPDEKDIYQHRIYKVATTGSLLIKITDLPYGEYAIALAQDENGNKKMDYRLLGMPKEPFGFSNNFKPLFTAPDFEDCAFNYSEKNNKLEIRLLNY
jgi:uncharacterized protein (DUF2141 family)